MKQIFRITLIAVSALLAMSCQNKMDDDAQYEALIPELQTDAAFIEFSETETVKTIAVTSNAYWKVSPANDWLKVTPREGKGNGTIEVRPATNTLTAARNGNITVSNGISKIEVAVTQATSPFQSPTVSAVQVEVLNKNTASCSFSFQSTDFVVSTHGVCYSSTEAEPTIDHAQKTAGSNINGGTVTFRLEQLTPFTQYYIRAYATTTRGVVYGEITSFTMPEANVPGGTDNPLPHY